MNDSHYNKLKIELDLLITPDQPSTGYLGFEIAGSFQIIATRPTRYYVRFDNNAYVEAYNIGRVPPEPNRPVELGYTSNGKAVILGDNLDTIEAFLGPNRSDIGIGYHTHDQPPLLDVVSDYRFRPGMLRAYDGTLSVFVEPFNYIYNRVERRFPGGPYIFDETDIPTDGKWWVKIYYDMAGESLIRCTGTEVPLTDIDPTLEDLANTERPDGYNNVIPLGGVILHASQTTPPPWRELGSARSYLGQIDDPDDDDLKDVPDVEGSYTNLNATIDGKGRVTAAANGSATDTDAIHKNVNSEIHVIANKTSPIGDDEILLEDSEDGFSKKRAKLSDLPFGTGGGGGGGDVTTTSQTIRTEIVLFDQQLVSDTASIIADLTLNPLYSECIDLRIVMHLRNDQTGNSGLEYFTLRPNGQTDNTGLLYNRLYWRGGSIASDSIYPFAVEGLGDDAPANNFSMNIFNILDFNGPNRKMAFVETINRHGASGGLALDTQTGTYDFGTNSPLTALEIISTTYPGVDTGLIKAGSRLTIYGTRDVDAITSVSGGGGGSESAHVSQWDFDKTMTSLSLATLPIDGIVGTVCIEITEAWEAGIDLTLGDGADVDRLVGVGEIDLTQQNVYPFNANLRYNVERLVTLYISDTSLTGAGKITLNYDTSG